MLIISTRPRRLPLAMLPRPRVRAPRRPFLALTIIIVARLIMPARPLPLTSACIALVRRPMPMMLLKADARAFVHRQLVPAGRRASRSPITRGDPCAPGVVALRPRAVVAVAVPSVSSARAAAVRARLAGGTTA